MTYVSIFREIQSRESEPEDLAALTALLIGLENTRLEHKGLIVYSLMKNCYQ